MISTTNKFAGVTRRKELTSMLVHCLVKFPSEGTHGVWPENLIRLKEGDKFAFQAKHGQKWFDCVVIKSGIFSCLLTLPAAFSSFVSMAGTKDQCDAGQLELEQEKTHGNQQAWSSADTEVSSDSSSDSGSVRVCSNGSLACCKITSRYLPIAAVNVFRIA